MPDRHENGLVFLFPRSEYLERRQVAAGVPVRTIEECRLKRRRFAQTKSLEERLAEQAEADRKRAKSLPPAANVRSCFARRDGQKRLRTSRNGSILWVEAPEIDVPS